MNPLATSLRSISPGRKEAKDLLMLALTCRRFAAVIESLRWAVFQVGTVRELGCLRARLIKSPETAKYIKDFVFAWDMDQECLSCCNSCPEAEGTLLDLAFRNRLQMWTSLRGMHDC